MNSGMEFEKSHLIPTTQSELMFFKGETKLSKEHFQNNATPLIGCEMYTPYEEPDGMLLGNKHVEVKIIMFVI